jgi:hypothetical protein
MSICVPVPYGFILYSRPPIRLMDLQFFFADRPHNGTCTLGNHQVQVAGGNSLWLYL